MVLAKFEERFRALKQWDLWGHVSFVLIASTLVAARFILQEKNLDYFLR
jgi:hypothetical protein